MQSSRVLLLGGPLLVLVLTTCAPQAPVEVTATDPPRALRGPVAPAVVAVDPPRRDLDGARRVAVATDIPLATDVAPLPSEAAAPPAPVEPAPEPPGPAPQPQPQPQPPPPPPPAGTVVAPEPPPPVVTAAQPSRVVVPRIGVDNPLVGVGLNPDRTLFVPDDAHVAGWYENAPRPGQTGPAIVLGHNTWKGVRGVFWHLHRLVPGDIVEVAYDDGSVVRFAVERVEQHPRDAFPTERVYGNTSRPEIRVITCGGVFDRQRGEHLDNIIVFGVLTG